MMTIKRLTTLVMLLVAMASGAKADTYKLWVGETQVTDANKGDILGDGTMTYDPATNTMTLDGTSITSHGNEDYAICNYAESGPVPGNIEVNKLIIEVKSDSQLSTDDQCLYFRAADITITGPGKLTLKSQYRDAICVVVSSLTFSEANILANGRDGVICGTGSALTIDHSTLNACPQYSNRRPVIYDFNEVQLKECYYADAAYDYCLWYGSNIYYDDNILELSYSGDYFSEESGDDIHWEGMYSSWLTILPTTLYDLYVIGTRVGESNKDDILGDQSCSFDADSKTLHLNGDIKTTDEANAIKSLIDDLTISVDSDCELQSGFATMNLHANTTIKGAGRLTLNPINNWGIWVRKQSKLTIADVTIEVMNATSGISCWSEEKGILLINNANIEVSSTDGAIYGFKRVTIENAEIVQPDGAVNQDGAISLDGEVAKVVSIKATKPIELYVGGVQVTRDNADDLTAAINAQGDPDITASGTIRYDIANNVLTLENATIEGPLANKAILSNGLCMNLFGSFLVLGGVPGLRIEVYGDCVLQNTSGMSAGMALSLATTIDVHSGATLTVKAYNYGLIVGEQVDIVEGNLSFEGGNPGRGIDGYTGSTLNLFEGKGTLCVKSGFSGISNLNLLNGTQIVSPEGAYYDAEERNIYDSNGYLAHDVVLSNATTPTRIDKPSTPVTHHPTAVYDLQGRLAPSYPRTPAPSKRKDIYIINGKKYINY